MLQNASPLRKSAPWPPNISHEHVFVLRLPREMHLCRSSSNAPRLPSFLEMQQNPHVLLTFDKVRNPSAYHAKRHLNLQKCSVPLSFLHFWLRNVLRATTACTFSTSQLPKVTRTWCVLYFWLRNVLRDISTSKSGLNLVCVVHFDFEMCFAPQRRALFRHLNFQKWSEHGVFCILTWKHASRHNGVHFFDISLPKSGPSMVWFCTFWLRNALRATTACNFSSLIWPAGSAPAALASLLFDRSLKSLENTQCFATFLPFRASASSFFWLFLFSDLLSSTFLFSLPLPNSAFHLPILSEVWLLNFLRWCFMFKLINLSMFDSIDSGCVAVLC